MIYLNKRFDEVFVNFVRIEAICSKCHLLFLSKSKLHKHIKSEYVEEILPFPSLQTFLSIRVIVLKVVHASIRSGFRFNGLTHAIAAVTLAPEHLP